jgi:predicted dehydrogenase
MWELVASGAVGQVRLIYAEFDDNPIYLMQPENWRSRSGAPWPYLHEYEMGCTVEHVGYHLAWMCSIFGPVATVTAFSKCTVPDKTDLPLDPADTPDFSVACLDFVSGVTARVTCSIAAPYDHRMRIVGDEGMVWADTYRHYSSPVYLERFNALTLNARKAVTVRQSRALQRLLGVNGQRVRLTPSPHQTGRERGGGRSSWSPKAVLRRVKQYELGQQDKVLGVAELADAIRTGRQHLPPSDFTIHLTELTLAIQRSGIDAKTHRLATSFSPIDPPGDRGSLDLGGSRWRRRIAGIVEPMLDRAHRH